MYRISCMSVKSNFNSPSLVEILCKCKNNIHTRFCKFKCSHGDFEGSMKEVREHVNRVHVY